MNWGRRLLVLGLGGMWPLLAFAQSSAVTESEMKLRIELFAGLANQPDQKNLTDFYSAKESTQNAVLIALGDLVKSKDLSLPQWMRTDAQFQGFLMERVVSGEFPKAQVAAQNLFTAISPEPSQEWQAPLISALKSTDAKKQRLATQFLMSQGQKRRFWSFPDWVLQSAQIHEGILHCVTSGDSSVQKAATEFLIALGGHRLQRTQDIESSLASLNQNNNPEIQKILRGLREKGKNQKPGQAPKPEFAEALDLPTAPRDVPIAPSNFRTEKELMSPLSLLGLLLHDESVAKEALLHFKDHQKSWDDLIALEPVQSSAATRATGIDSEKVRRLLLALKPPHVSEAIRDGLWEAIGTIAMKDRAPLWMEWMRTSLEFQELLVARALSRNESSAASARLLLKTIDPKSAAALEGPIAKALVESDPLSQRQAIQLIQSLGTKKRHWSFPDWVLKSAKIHESVLQCVESPDSGVQRFALEFLGDQLKGHRLQWTHRNSALVESLLNHPDNTLSTLALRLLKDIPESAVKGVQLGRNKNTWEKLILLSEAMEPQLNELALREIIQSLPRIRSEGEGSPIFQRLKNYLHDSIQRFPALSRTLKEAGQFLQHANGKRISEVLAGFDAALPPQILRIRSQPGEHLPSDCSRVHAAAAHS